ncbi:MAG: hypothetical protein E2P02_19715 [Acidobacteria bacterium]|nr:MAG: hypothetical protein E2P02_19715 [Acidobacteriota bacterium]
MHFAVIRDAPAEEWIEALAFEGPIGRVVVLEILHLLPRAPVDGDAFGFGVGDRFREHDRHFLGVEARILGNVGADDTRVFFADDVD